MDIYEVITYFPTTTHPHASQIHLQYSTNILQCGPLEGLRGTTRADYYVLLD